MDSWIGSLAFLAIWWLVMVVLLPRAGVST